jgi:hypothetical protein
MIGSLYKADDKTFNKRNIVPMIGAAIGTIGAALAITAIFSPALFGLLSISLVALGFTPALLGVIAVLSIVVAAVSIQQMFTNRTIEEAKGTDGKDANFTALVGDTLKTGQIVENADKNGLELKLSAADYSALTTSKNANDDVTLYVLLAGKAVEVKSKHVNDANDGTNYKVTLTGVGDKTGFAEMKTALGDNLGKDLTVFDAEEAAQTITTNVIVNAVAQRSKQ